MLLRKTPIGPERFRSVLRTVLGAAMLFAARPVLADTLIETRTGERIVLRSDGTFLRLPGGGPGAGFAGRRAPGVEVLGDLPFDDRADSAGGPAVAGPHIGRHESFAPELFGDGESFDMDAAGAGNRSRADDIADALGVPSPDAPSRPGASASSRPDIPDYRDRRASVSGFVPGRMPSGGSVLQPDVDGYGRSAAYSDMGDSLREPSSLSGEGPLYESVSFQNLWDPGSPPELEPDRSLIEIRGWISSQGSLGRVMLFPDRTVSWDYAVLRAGRLAAEERRSVSRSCRSVCEVLIRGRLMHPVDGKPQIEAHDIVVMP